MERKLREELNALSKQVFGVSSKWQKFVDRGFPEAMERTREAMIMVDGIPEKKTFIDRKSVIKRYTVDEIKTLMLGTIAQRQALVHKEPVPTLANTYVEGAIPAYGDDKGTVINVQGDTVVLPKASYGALGDLLDGVIHKES